MAARLRRKSNGIRISLFKTVQATRELLERELFENPNNRQWIFHPRQAEVAERLQITLQDKVDQSKIKFAAHLEHQAKVRADEALSRVERAAQFAWQPTQSGATNDFSYGLEWRASFPPAERWEPARAAFCGRLGVSMEKVDAVMAEYSKRSHLATTNPQALATNWAAALNVPASEIYRYFQEAGYT